jgi:hydroxymethylpyrimidine pyrophosphatase-like HAD family hydrolase
MRSPDFEVAEAILFDGDGTAFEHGATSPSTELVQALSQLAIPAYLCSGRSRKDGEQMVHELGQSRAWLSGGASAFKLKPDGRVLQVRYDRFPIAHFDAPAIHLFLDGLVENIPDATTEVPNWDYFMQGLVPTPVQPGFWTDEHVDSIFVRNIPDLKEAIEIAETVEKEFIDYGGKSNLYANAVIGQNPEVYDVQVNARNGHKGSAVEREALLKGIDPDAIFVFGDGLNDIPMFEAAGYSFAMGNAHDTVKEAADEVIGTQGDGAFIETLARFRQC